MKTKLHLSTLARTAQAILMAGTFAVIIGTANLAIAASPSDLLEKAIYSEETKGDLDAAMQLYQQVVTEAKGTQAVAAQAQYRLGVCHYKKKNYAEANAAFEKVVKEYADQKELVASANKYLASAVELLPAPWADGEELLLDIKFPTGFKIGAATYSIGSGETNGQKIWKLRSHLYAGVQQLSQVEVLADSFKPLHCRWTHTLIGEADTVFGNGEARLKLTGKDNVMTLNLQGVVYDNEEAVQLMRRLPLADKYKTDLRIYTGLGNGAVISLGIEVLGIEKVEVPAGTFECYKVELSVRQTFWVSTDAHRYIVKFEGGGVIGELNAINVRKPGAPVTYQDAALGFSMATPANWLVFPMDDRDEKGNPFVLAINPEGDATVLALVGKKSDLKPEAQKSLRAWADQKIAAGDKIFANLKVRPDSWKERTVAGNPALSFVGDFAEGKDKRVVSAVLTFGKTNAAMLVLKTLEKDFDALQPDFESILDSYKGK